MSTESTCLEVFSETMSSLVDFRLVGFKSVSELAMTSSILRRTMGNRLKIELVWQFDLKN